MNKNHLWLIVTILIITITTLFKINLSYIKMANFSGDLGTHLHAVSDLITGVNPYTWTIQSYNNLQNDPGNKGYAYLPGIMYTNTIIYIFHILIQNYFNLKIPIGFLIHMPGIIANIFIGLFFIKTFYKKDNYAMIFGTTLVLINPYITTNFLLEGYDFVVIAILLWAFYFLQKDTVLSGALYSLAIIFKTFPIILVLIFLYKSNNKAPLILAALMIGIFFSLPFLTSYQNFITYIQGAVLVHGERFIQGRPYLFYLSYYFKIELIQIIPFKFYAYASIFLGQLLLLGAYVLKKFEFDKYTLSLIPFTCFYIFTPVLNRTHLLWGLPFFIMGTYNLISNKKIFYTINIIYWVFLYWYLQQWVEGFHHIKGI